MMSRFAANNVQFQSMKKLHLIIDLNIFTVESCDSVSLVIRTPLDNYLSSLDLLLNHSLTIIFTRALCIGPAQHTRRLASFAYLY